MSSANVSERRILKRQPLPSPVQKERLQLKQILKLREEREPQQQLLSRLKLKRLNVFFLNLKIMLTQKSSCS